LLAKTTPTGVVNEKTAAGLSNERVDPRSLTSKNIINNVKDADRLQNVDSTETGADQTGHPRHRRPPALGLRSPNGARLGKRVAAVHDTHGAHDVG